ncbi:PD-(D/E)XK nuclease family transposase domain protein [Leptospira inadai serovar Lyme str. 10]|uniref:PD-(D/E)XK nuclease family transposase domain protein n=1 Tax=Leptospira inadai serovar Lyme str. 10 TaxID=1049790 RepID=V6HIR5_9LEPT|nr:PD-(D/E)XK nuclease family transposase domain protein [Leptospira inadai serovar Lyme str. 10]
MPFFPLTNDLVFKSLFVEEPKLLSSILTSVLYPNGDHRVEEITILNPELPTDYPGDKRSYLDLRARDESGKIFHVCRGQKTEDGGQNIGERNFHVLEEDSCVTADLPSTSLPFP